MNISILTSALYSIKFNLASIKPPAIKFIP